MKRTLVIGATGNIGRQVVSQLAAGGAPVRALARNPESAVCPAQAEIVRADLTLPETLDRCLDGIDAVFLAWTAPKTAVDAALERIAKRVRRIDIPFGPRSRRHTRCSNNPTRVEIWHRTSSGGSRHPVSNGHSCDRECSR